MKFQRHSLVVQGKITRLCESAEQATSRGDHRQSVEILERASRLDPANPNVWLLLGSAHGRCYDYVAADDCFEKALRLTTRKTELLALAGQRCRDFGNYEMGARWLQRAVQQNDVPPDTLVKLAEIYERLRRLEEAIELTDRALQMDGVCVSAQLLRAKLDRRAGRLVEAENRLRALLANSDRIIRVQGSYELAAILDRQGRYDEAMNALLEAKALARADAPSIAARTQAAHAWAEESLNRLTTEKLQAWRDSEPALQPVRRLAVLCGHARSGTTLLEQVLDSHPEIVSAEETPIFLNYAHLTLARGFPENTPLQFMLDNAQAGVLNQCRQNYFRGVELFLGRPVADRLLIDKNPSLTRFIPLCVRVFPELKLLVAIRDPRDVCLSCFMQPYYSIAPTSPVCLSLEQTIEDYAELMGRWLKLAPLFNNSSIEVRYEDMVNDLEAVARRTLDFLGLAWDPSVLKFDEHARQKVVRSPTYADVIKPVFKTAVGRWRNYQEHFEPHLKKLEPFVRRFGYE
jgi:tetratricopeptide (TPR) repeat protein